ncbi:hypothetical protein SEA_WHOSEMANZ_17 [Gordonia phage WhoseManz]|uniref:Uncharacterized protein n=2 Tax=Sukkupivirus TaxID=2948917 RepID=A0A5Q2WIX6_9CAUD|nr:hypothetical protein KNU78_gp17 [Gordonia phage Sukkupi]YP_010104688.1 hypothetical protein KNU79_gp16 [Gordonia phage NadineRae]QAU06343.1 hypothetical protein SEA_WHOSEMANZ_17 [Gordonia phage WhoseManz]QAU07066.1 hypothetical protein SEA_BIPAUNETO_18 [Gordonia phage BiPauneto]QGH80733.1 hypothetical protein SEA_YNDEXA_17 [Gordonia phage Yndexa]QFP97778.1 hypothetical protein SEA_NADINERAE_16 [Gordonia phage NadineRae]QGH79260.1 hypothetical protein SEA_SUKKUPI_17 [Gordonia phage Sukkupi]
MSEEMSVEEISQAALETIKNAVNVEIKARYGDEFFVANAMVIALVERPRGDLEKPDAKRFRLFLKTLGSIPAHVGIGMMREAAAIFQARRAQNGESN